MYWLKTKYSFLVVILKECIWEELPELHTTNSVQNGEMAKEGLDSTKEAVGHFTQCAKAHQELKFYVTPVGCGIAGYTSKEIGPLFRDAAELSNVYLPISFWKVLLGITD